MWLWVTLTVTAYAPVCACMSLSTHLHHPHRRSSCKGSRSQEPQRMPTGWCDSAIAPYTGPSSGPGRPAWPSAAGHSSRGVRLAASWMAVSCPPRQIHLTLKTRGRLEEPPRRATPKEIGAETLLQLLKFVSKEDFSLLLLHCVFQTKPQLRWCKLILQKWGSWLPVEEKCSNK